MKNRTIFWLKFGLVLIILSGCLPDRMAPDPVDINRPKFLGFGAQDSAAINVALNHPVTMIFNRRMDLSTFPGNFTLQSISGPVGGTFTLADNADSVVIFTPGANMEQAEVYTAYVGGGVRANNGMSRLSPNEPDVPETIWFFTTGQYAHPRQQALFLVPHRSPARVLAALLIGGTEQYESAIAPALELLAAVRKSVRSCYFYHRDVFL